MTAGCISLVYLWLIVVFALTSWGYCFGRWAALHGRRRVVQALLFSWAGLMLCMLLGHHPEWEYHLLWWDGYVYLRAGGFLPFAAIGVGAAAPFVDARSARALHALLVFLLAVGVYEYRWGVGLTDLTALRGERGFFGVVRSSSADTTGASAAATLVYYYGVPVSEGWMAKATLSRPRGGASLVGLCRGVQQALSGSACEVRVKRLTFAELLEQPLPLLLIVDESLARSQALVVFTLGKDGAVVGDPRRGVTFVDRDTLERLWTGHAIVVEAPFWLEPRAGARPWV